MLEEDVIERTLGTLLDHEIQEVSPSPGQGVIVWYKGRWHRASLIGFYEGGWRCEMVDIGMMVEGKQKVKQCPAVYWTFQQKPYRFLWLGWRMLVAGQSFPWRNGKG